MADITATTAATYINEHWSPKASVVYAAKRVLAPLLDHTWEPELVGNGDIVNIPAFTETTPANVQKRSTFGTGASVTFAAVTEDKIQLAVDQMAYYAFRLPVELSPQLYADYEGKLTREIGNAVYRKQDSEIADGNTNGFDAFTATGTDNVPLTEQVVIDANVTLDNVHADDADRFLVVSPATYADLLQIESARNELYKSSVGGLTAGKGPGYCGDWMGLHVYKSANLEAGTSGKKNALFQREAIAIATQKKITIRNVLNITDGAFEEYIGFITYGLKMVKSNHGAELDGR